MAAGGGEGDGEKSAFRCLDAARYVAAALVVVLIAAVIVNAIRVVLRPDEITLSVVGNFVSVMITARAPPLLNFKFTLRAVNPGGRVRLYYYNITTYFFTNDSMATTSTPADDSTIYFTPDHNITLAPEVYVDSIVAPPDVIGNDSDVIDPTFFDALYKQGQGGRVDGVTMRVDGQLVSEIRSGYNTSAQNMTLYCRDLVFGPEDKVAMDSKENTCTTS